ncbi:MAG: hypothetical protein CMP36_00420 [Rickettsiales bacterium]|nr:hypothetical protein [Rickettsiales bacterium]OUV83274.1 MAG: hypothetical protein CBC91_00800 [Rickettsiales bacterium TMED131]
MYKIIIIILTICFLPPAYADNINNTKKLEEVIEKFILENPEILIKSLEQFTQSQKDKEKETIENSLNDFYDKKLYENYPSIGNSSNDLILIEFIDYNCGYCKKTLPTITKLIKNFEKIKIVFIDFPILTEMSELSARASLAANNQEAYFKFHSILLKNNKSINEDYLINIARSLELDIEKFKKDMFSSNIEEQIKRNIALANKLKIRGTPTFIVNKQILPGAYDYDKLKSIILNKT